MRNTPEVLKLLGRLASLTLLAACTVTTWAESPQPVTVKVYGQHLNDRVVYHYRLVNSSQGDIAGVWVGYRDRDHRIDPVNPLELEQPPLEKPAASGDDELQATSPANWRVYRITDEDGERFAVAWTSSDENGSRIGPLVEPGGILTGMSVAVSKPDPQYISSYVSILFGGQKYFENFSVPLEREDTSAPNISVSLNPASLWPPNAKPVTVKAQVEVKDNLDPNPVVRLESITSNEALENGDISGAEIGKDDRSFELRAKRDGTSKQGRTYTITYSATDATGNAATAVAAVTVPHDQR